MNILNSFFKKKERVNYKELIKHGAVIIDVRSKAEFDRGHCGGAINIPLDTLSTSIKKIKDKNTHIITCCASGMRSNLAKKLLHAAGYENVTNGGNWTSLNNEL